ncbi:uncharacterized protein [Pithys albifrons albifrons]|uniref:uncharacterized protein isoform X1 n=1 Tax=Pithys albifrons albifrons TaxID=3385563 RepID=UPI003A5CB44D
MATEPVPRQSGTEAGRALEEVPAATAGAGPEKQFCCSWEESGPGEVNPELPVEPGRDAGAGTVRGGGADCGVWREKRLKLRGLCLFPAVPSGSPGLQGIPLASCLLSLQPGVLGGFLKLIALKASDPQGFDLLNSIMKHMPPESVDWYRKQVFILLFQRLPSSKPTKLIKRFLCCRPSLLGLFELPEDGMTQPLTRSTSLTQRILQAVRLHSPSWPLLGRKNMILWGKW